MSDWNNTVIDEFRANGGKVAQFGDAPVVILHTIGAKSGQQRDIPLVALVGDGGELTVFASKAGAQTNPDWYHNLKANPDITVEYGAESFDAKVEELPETEGQARLRAQAALIPTFGEYVTSAAPRVIPAFSITRV
jgi:deazaflavin-dependent oxidoreductase (nitroreductase family)